MAGSTSVPDRGRHRHDQPGTSRDYSYLCGLSRCGILGFGSLDDRHFPSVVPAGAYRRTTARTSSGQSQRAGICQRRLCGSDRNDPGRMHPSGTHCHRRLAHRPDRAGLARHSVSLEGQQSAPDRRDGGRGPDRVPAATAHVGHDEILNREGEMGRYHPPMEVNMSRRKILLMNAVVTVLGLAALIGFADQNAIFAAEDDDKKALVKLLGASKINLQQGLAASEQQGQPMSAKFEDEEGKLQLSV